MDADAIICNLTQLSTTNSSEEISSFCNLERFKEIYIHIHGYLAIITCLIGIIFNMLNILVLTSKDMRLNPINLILTGIAFADIVLMVEYIPFTVHMYLIDDDERTLEEKYSWSWGTFLLFHTNFTITIHTVSTWLTLSLAIWRFIMIKFSSYSTSLCTIQRCKIVLLLGFIIPPILAIPNFLSIHVGSHQQQDKDGSCVILHMLEINNKLLFSMNVWLYTFILKLLPCIFLTIFTGSLIRELYRVDENATRLRRGSIPNEALVAARRASYAHIHSRKVSRSEMSPGPRTDREKNTDKTTKLLSAVLILFLVAEFPQGILGMLSAIFGQQFFMECYNPVGEMMDMMALINGAANFIPYCLMSSQFWNTLSTMFRIEKKPLFLSSQCLRQPSSQSKHIVLTTSKDLQISSGINRV